MHLCVCVCVCVLPVFKRLKLHRTCIQIRYHNYCTCENTNIPQDFINGKEKCCDAAASVCIAKGCCVVLHTLLRDAVMFCAHH